jgi:competence protein ComEC
VKKKTSNKKKSKLIYSILASAVFLAGAFLQKNGYDLQKHVASFKYNQLNSVMEVHFIDVGQADSILIESGGKYMLVDAGTNEDGELVVDYLKKEGVSKLDYVIATHPHEDHIGGMDDVINSFSIGTVFMPDVTHTTQTFEDVLTAISGQNLEITIPQVGEQYTIGEASFVILAPNSDDYGTQLNNYSIGIKLVNGNNSFLMCGDAEKEAEHDILKNGIDIKAQVYKVSHHGSNTATTEEFLDAVSPEYAVIECGQDNDYGHPNKETLDKFKARGIEVFRTDMNGTVVAESDGTNITWSSEK